MRKLFTLMTLLLAMVTTNVYAGDTFTLSNFEKGNKKYTVSVANFFTVNNTQNNADKYACTYDGTSYKAGMKMGSSDYISFTTKAKANITIVQGLGYNKDNYIQFDKTALAASDRTDTDKAGVYSLTGVEAGDHIITRNDKEIGIVYVKVEYTGTEMTQLTAPTISFNEETGQVTIAQAESKTVYYTVDGKTPSSTNGTKYESAFTVKDGTTIQAIAEGDGTTTLSSAVSSYYALLKTVTIEKPIVTAVNGTVAISCKTPKTTFKYSINGGDYQDYSYPFTLTEDATVKAQASRTNCTSVESDAVNVVTVKNSYPTKTVLIYWDTTTLFDEKAEVSGTNNYTLVGKTGTDVEGYSLELNKSGKAYSSLKEITINGEKKNAIKLSNGAENILHLPDGVKASRMTIYSVFTGGTARVSGWSNVNGTQEYQSIPMGATGTDPDVRVYALNNATDKISFTNAGEQVGFVIALDVIDESASIEVKLGASGMGTFSAPSAHKVPTGLTAYTAKYASEKVTLTKIEDGIIPAGKGVVLSGTANTSYTLDAATETSSEQDNDLTGATVATTIDNELTYVLICNSNNKGQFAKLKSGEIVPAGKAYLTLQESAGANLLSLDFGTETAINAIENNAQKADNNYYTLDGKKIEKPAKGAYIHNGKVYSVK